MHVFLNVFLSQVTLGGRMIWPPTPQKAAEIRVLDVGSNSHEMVLLGIARIP